MRLLAALIVTGVSFAQLPPTITSTSPLPAGTVGTAYSYQFTASGSSPITWSGISIPAGLTLSSTGLLSGTPTTAATVTLNVTATNSAGSAGPTGFQLTVNPVGGHTYYVSTTGSNANTCTQAQNASTPKLYVSQGVACATNPGDTVMIAAGTYGNEGIHSDGTGGQHGYFSPSHLTWAGTSTAPITVRGADPNNPPVLDGGTTDASNLGPDMFFTLDNSSAQWWVFQYLNITRTAATGINTNNGGSHVKILNCNFHDIGNWVTPATLGFGMSAVGGDSTAVDWTVDSNIITNVGRTGWSGCTGPPPSGNCPIQHLDHGIYAGFQGAVISNNLIYSNVHGSGIQNHDGQNWQIVNNTFVFQPFQPYDGHLNLWGNNSNIVIRNNIFFQAGAQVANVYMPTGTGCTFDHNTVYPATTTFNATGFCTETSTSNSNPLLVNTATTPYDFHLQSGSPAIDAGISTGITHDYAGTTRPQGAAYDIGAYEYVTAVGPPCTISPTSLGPYTLGQAFASPSNPIVLTATSCGTSSWILTGFWPTGLTGAASGTQYNVTGTITAAGTFTPSIIYGTANQAYSILVNPAPAITTTTLPGAILGGNYSQVLGTSGGTGSLTCSLLTGTLPPGLTLSSSCLISGVPTSAGTYNFTAGTTDANGISGSKALMIVVNNPLNGLKVSGAHSCTGCRF